MSNSFEPEIYTANKLKKNNLLITFSIILSICFHLFAVYHLHNRPIYRFTSVNEILKRKEIKIESERHEERQELIKAFFNKIERGVSDLSKDISPIALPSKPICSQKKSFISKDPSSAIFVFKEEMNYLLLHIPSVKLVHTRRAIAQELIAVLRGGVATSSSKKSMREEESIGGINLEKYSFKGHFLKQKEEKEFSEINKEKVFVAKRLLTDELALLTRTFDANKKRNFSNLVSSNFKGIQTISYNEAFDVDILLLPKIKEEGYLFAITLILKPGYNIEGFKENFLFLLDRSNSIQSERLNISKHAIEGALNCLKNEDTFNIVAFDNQIDMLSIEGLPRNKESLLSVKNFLTRQELGSFFFSANYVPPLTVALQEQKDINVVILLTDGNSLAKQKNYKIFEEWTKRNIGKNPFFALAINDDPNLSLLEYFTFLNKGTTYVSTTKRGIKRQLSNLVKSIRSPIGKDISFNLVPCDGEGKVDFNIPKNRAPMLYADKPYVILGSVNQMSDFFLFLQGKSKEGWFSIKKKISFKAAKRGGKELEKSFAEIQAHKCYEAFLADERVEHLKEARAILEPYDRY